MRDAFVYITHMRPVMLIPLLKEIRHNLMLWLLAIVPAVFVGEKARPALLSHATESVAAKTGDAVGGLRCS